MSPALRNKAALRLPKLATETLVKGLLDLAEWSPDAANLVESLIATPEESLATFKRKLSGIKRRNRFYHRSDAGKFANELSALFDLLDKPGIPPKDLLKALVTFFESDNKLMEMADDSHGEMGYIFKDVATPLFAKTAAHIDDQPYLRKVFLKLYLENNYGVRDSIVNHAHEFFPRESLLKLREHYKKEQEKNPDQFTSGHLCRQLAAQLRDPELFESELRSVNEHYYKIHILDLAQVYQAAGRHEDLANRLEDWLSKIEGHQRSRLEEIAVETYSKIQQPDAAKALRLEAFKALPSTATLKEFAEFASPSEIKEETNKATSIIISKEKFLVSGLEFLLQTEQYLAANNYLLTRCDQLSNGFYGNLLPIARSFSSHGYPLAASLIYRELADSTLASAYTKAYRHGAKYLVSLHELASSITDWMEHPSHASYLQELHRIHFRKTSFWKLIPDETASLAQTED